MGTTWTRGSLRGGSRRPSCRPLPANSVIVMDNASFHRKSRLPELAGRAGHVVLFLPPYSPELNPIENFWGWLKRQLRKILPDCPTFDYALCSVFEGR
ncbi:MAG: transposase [Holophagales bacterium]|nr:transposase [Holophagales bacterium]